MPVGAARLVRPQSACPANDQARKIALREARLRRRAEVKQRRASDLGARLVRAPVSVQELNLTLDARRAHRRARRARGRSLVAKVASRARKAASGARLVVVRSARTRRDPSSVGIHKGSDRRYPAFRGGVLARHQTRRRSRKALRAERLARGTSDTVLGARRATRLPGSPRVGPGFARLTARRLACSSRTRRSALARAATDALCLGVDAFRCRVRCRWAR